MGNPSVCEDANQFLVAFKALQSNSLKKYHFLPKAAQATDGEAADETPSPPKNNVASSPKNASTDLGSSSRTNASPLATSVTTTAPHSAEKRPSGAIMPSGRPERPPETHYADLKDHASHGSEGGENEQIATKEKVVKDCSGSHPATTHGAETIGTDGPEPGSDDKHENLTPAHSASSQLAADGHQQHSLFPPGTAQKPQEEHFVVRPVSACSMAAHDSDGSDEVVFRQDEYNDVGNTLSHTEHRSQFRSVASGGSTGLDQQDSPGDLRHWMKKATATISENQRRGPTLRAHVLKNKHREAAQTDTPGRCGTEQAANRDVSLAPYKANDHGDNDAVEEQTEVDKTDAREELPRRQKGKMIEIGMKQRVIVHDAPKTSLQLARQGPGTDPSSPITQEFSRLVTKEGKATPISPFSDNRYENDTESPILIRDPSDHRMNISKAHDAVVDHEGAAGWMSDSLIVDWQYRPWQTCGDEHFVRNFRSWLENTLKLPQPVHTDSKSFADGTGHNDGITGLADEDFECEDAFLDLSDPGNNHAHETAAGYAYNWVIRLQKEKQESTRKRHKLIASTPVSDHTPELHPYAPRVKTYLRPVEPKDFPQLAKLYNWYVKNTKRVTDLDEITEDGMIEFAAEAEGQNLPFLVAAEHKPGVWHAMNNEDENVYGFIGALDFTGPRSVNRYTAELQLFVHPGIYRRGVGRCLVDRTLEILDPQYPAKHGYYFDCPNDKRQVYCSGGARTMSRLVFIVHHPADAPEEYAWLKKWLEKDFGFEEQGLLKGLGIRDRTILNAGYLVYNTGVKPVAGKTQKNN